MSMKQKGDYGVRNISDGARNVSDGARNVSDGARNVSDGVRSISDGARNISDGVRNVSDAARKHADGTVQCSCAGSGLASKTNCIPRNFSLIPILTSRRSMRLITCHLEPATSDACVV